MRVREAHHGSDLSKTPLSRKRERGRGEGTLSLDGRRDGAAADVRWVSGGGRSRKRPARDGRAGLRAGQESAAMKSAPSSGCASCTRTPAETNEGEGAVSTCPRSLMKGNRVKACKAAMHRRPESYILSRFSARPYPTAGGWRRCGTQHTGVQGLNVHQRHDHQGFRR